MVCYVTAVMGHVIDHVDKNYSLTSHVVEILDHNWMVGWSCGMSCDSSRGLTEMK